MYVHVGFFFVLVGGPPKVPLTRISFNMLSPSPKMRVRQGPSVHEVLKIFHFAFSVNLSIADTMVSSLNVTFNYVYMLNGHWPFGNIYCKLCSFISIISVCASVFTLVAISTDR